MITVVQQPQHFTPVGNPIIFQIQSDFANIVSFRVEVLEATSDKVIHIGEYDVRPDYKNGTIIQLNEVLKATVKHEVNNSISLLSKGFINPVINYKLKVTEKGLINGLMADLAPVYEFPTTFYTWEAEMNSFEFDGYNQQDYLISVGLPSKFLTNKPDNSIVTDYSAEQLYFLHEAEDKLKVVVKTYDANNSILNIAKQDIANTDQYKMFRVQVSPKALAETLLIDFALVKKYTVHIEDEANKARTETRTYWYKKLPCNLEFANLLWINSLGGLDSFTFVNPVATTNINRNTIKKNPYKFHNGLYSNRTDEMLNASEEVVHLSKYGTYTAYTQEITDAESEWFNELFTSKQVYLELADESVVPVIVENNTYLVQQQRLNKSNFITTSVTYRVNGDIIPFKKVAVETEFGTGQLQSDFIDKQMNGWSAYDTILYFHLTEIDGREGVGGAVSAIHPTLLFEFNKIQGLIGLPQDMTIYVDGNETMNIAFMGDYVGKDFRFTDKLGNQYYGKFIHGEVYF